MARKKKIHDPAESMRLRLEQVAARAERDRLKAQGVDAVVVTEADDAGIKRWVAKGQRKDVFKLLLDRRALSQDGFNAIRRYEEALDTSMGHNTPERRPDHIRATVEGAPGQNISQAMILASHRTRWIRDRLSDTDRRLLDALRLNAPGQWRVVVQMITGETNDKAHAPRVRALADNVQSAHASFDRLSKKAA